MVAFLISGGVKHLGGNQWLRLAAVFGPQSFFDVVLAGGIRGSE